jgi:hypothetical protein
MTSSHDGVLKDKQSKIGENDDPRSHTIGHPLSGWQLELGSALGSKSQTEFPLEDTEKYEYYYRDHFHKKGESRLPHCR